MLYARIQHGQGTTYCRVEGDRVRLLTGDLFGTWQETDQSLALADVKLLVPVVPSKVLAVGLNYRSHLGGRPLPEEPAMFLKPPSCLVPTGADIVLPRVCTDVHYEGEMVVVVGKRARHVGAQDAPGYVLGVTCGNDVSARPWQKNDLQWWRAKGSDTFGPCGPFIATGINYDNLHLQLRVNRAVKQEQRTSDLVHGVAAILSYVSRYMTLEPGDLIYTGTPGQTTALNPGDVVEVELEGVGILRNRVVAVQHTP
jgi:2-keto-4-pentenoate hydratase/2-oxohepta-3-ene-1,7-dioic acid hydratase in catechol pathway